MRTNICDAMRGKSEYRDQGVFLYDEGANRAFNDAVRTDILPDCVRL